MSAKDTAQIDGEPTPLLRVRRASKSFPGVKSTLTKIIGGGHQPDAGTIEYDGS